MASPYTNPKINPQINPHVESPWNERPLAKTTPTPQVTFNSLFSDQFFLGFNDQLARWQTLNKKASFPPYNLIKEDKDNYRIELAVAGYSKDEIDISVQVDLLTVKGSKDEDEDKFIHQGIAGRDWQQDFVLGEWISVKEASLKDGLLTIRLEREVPEELKAKVIKIK